MKRGVARGFAGNSRACDLLLETVELCVGAHRQERHCGRTLAILEGLSLKAGREDGLGGYSQAERMGHVPGLKAGVAYRRRPRALGWGTGVGGAVPKEEEQI